VPEFSGKPMTRTVLVLLALLLSSITAQALDVEKLYGTWKILSFTQHFVATDETIEVFGKNPTGFLSYTRNGRMNAILVSDTRPRPADMAQATTEDKAQLLTSMYAYAGTFTVDGNTVIHLIDVSWNENWTGTKQVRNVRLEDDRLYISTNPQSNGFDGKIIVGELVWERVK